MRLRIADRVLVAVAGVLLLACCAAIVAQMFFDVDLVSFAARVFSSDSPRVHIALIALAVFLLLLGIYCVFVLFRHRRRKDKFFLQKSESGELAISVKALENMVQKCLDQHEEIKVQHLFMENEKDGLLIRIRGSVAGGISIPLTVEALQKQIRQYVTACSGIEIKGIRVQIDSSGEDAKNAPFAIAAPAAQPLLHEGEQKSAEVLNAEEKSADPASDQETASKQEEPASKPAPAPAAPEEDDDRPLHQRLFTPKQEPCMMPEPPAESEEIQAIEGIEDKEDHEMRDKMVEKANEIAEELRDLGIQDVEEEEAKKAPAPMSDKDDDFVEVSRETNTDYLASLKAFDEVVAGEKEEN